MVTLEAPEFPATHRYTECMANTEQFPLREIQQKLSDSYTLGEWENTHIKMGRKG